MFSTRLEIADIIIFKNIFINLYEFLKLCLIFNFGIFTLFLFHLVMHYLFVGII